MKNHVKKVRTIISIVLVASASIVKGQVFINEIMINPSGTSDGANMPNTAEWVEFYNASSSAVNIGCWFFTDGDFAVTFPAGTTIPAGGYFTVASAIGSGLTPNLNWATCGCTSGPTSEVGIFTNSAEQVILYNASGTIIDAIIWSTGQLPDGMTTSVIGSCSAQTVTFPANGSTYESVGSNTTDGVAKERSVDGGSVWQNTTIATFGTANDVVLPIELIDFTAEYKNNVVKLNWITASELNNDFYTIERSKDGIEFEEISKVKANGTTQALSSYETQDKTPFVGLSYYRLKQTDFDGTFSYSKIVSIETFLMDEVKVYPIPVENGVLYISTKRSEASIKVIDLSGRVIYQTELKNNLLEMNLNELSKGLYFVHVISNDSTTVKKITIH